MKKRYVLPTQLNRLLLLWAVLLSSQPIWAQSIPDAQWARVGNTLAITTDGNIVTSSPTAAAGISKYDLTGNRLWAVGPMAGPDYIAGKLPPGFCPCINGYGIIEKITRISPQQNGGITFAGNAWGGIPVRGSVDATGHYNGSYHGSFDALIATPDGGNLEVSSFMEYVGPGYESRRGVTVTKTGSQSWTTKISYPAPAPDISFTKANVAINTPDGGYLLAGFYNPAGADSPGQGWVAKLDGQGNLSWQKNIGIPFPGSPGPMDVYFISTVTDALVLADRSGYALVGAGRAYPETTTTALVEIDLNGDVKKGRAKVIDPLQATNAYITPYTGSGGKKLYAVGNTSLQDRPDPQILLVDPASLATVVKRIFPGPGASSLTDIDKAGDGSLVFVTDNNQLVKLLPEPTTPTPPAGGSLALLAPTYNCATGAITFNTSGGNGSTIEYQAAGITGWTTNPNQFVDKDSRTATDVKPFTLMARQSGVVVTYVWDLRAYCSGTPNPPTPPTPPVTPPTGGSLALLAPTYNCTTGAITFNTSGGNGSPIEYQAAGITGWTTNPNQFVDKDSRTASDVKPFTLMARQNGVIVTYVWDLRAYCNGTPMPKPPVLNRPIPDLTLKVGESANFPLGSYFSDPTTGIPSYRPDWFVNVSGLPPGLSLFIETVEIMFTPAAAIAGTATTAGSYLVTVTAGTRASGSSVSTTFTIFVLPQEPISGHQLTLLAPDYNCATGAFTFKTFGGNGSPVEYSAAGITGWTTNPNQFVDKDSRTANDVKPFTLMARQSGLVVSYVWDLKAACGRARRAATEPVAGLHVRVLGNPVENQSAMVEISGATNQSVQLNLVDLRGRLLHQQWIGQAAETERVRVPMGETSGLFLLNVSTATQQQQVKLLKP